MAESISALLVDAQFGIAHDVDEKNVCDLQSEFRFLFVPHRGFNLGGSGDALYINFSPKSDNARSTAAECVAAAGDIHDAHDLNILRTADPS
jgi:hypothetical protein